MKILFIMVVGVFSWNMAQAVSLEVTSGQVEFLAIGKPSAIKIRGQGRGLKSDLQWSEGKLTGRLLFDLNSLSTGIELRDQHMKEKYLETGRFSQAEFVLNPVLLKKDLCKEVMPLEKEPFQGTLKLHGVEKTVSGDFDLKSEKDRGRALVRFALNISDYKMEVPIYLGIKITDRIENSVTLEWTCGS